jgi:hypothetical protein
MIACQTFRSRFQPATTDAELLEHLRCCDGCLDHAAHLDPDVLFRALGGAEMVPPGGLDAFVGDVMREVRLRSTEESLAPHKTLSWPRRLAVAAAFAAGITGTALVYQSQRMTGEHGPVPAAAFHTPVSVSAVQPVKLTTKPIVETYDSQNATIVEVPNENASNVQVVMIFDEKLPADL